PVELLIAHYQPVHDIEGAQDVFARTQPQGAQENRPQKLALAINAHVQDVLLIVFEFHTRSAIRYDLAQEIDAIIRCLKEHSRGTLKFADDNAFSPVHDE